MVEVGPNNNKRIITGKRIEWLNNKDDDYNFTKCQGKFQNHKIAR